MLSSSKHIDFSDVDDFRENQNFGSKVSVFQLLKWFFRRLRKCFILVKSKIFLSILVFTLFCLFSHFYLFTPIVFSNSFVQKSGTNFALSDKPLSQKTWYKKTIWQIDDQLKKIELKVKENRKILQHIRSTINLAHLKKINQTFSNVKLSEKVFYEEEKSCSSQSTELIDVDINMKNVYDELLFDNPDGGVWKQGWPIKVNKQDFLYGHTPKLKVFLVIHSHNDPGWIKTFDSYFKDQTKSILTNAVEQLWNHGDLKMIWAETSFLSAWWSTIESNQHRQMLRHLVKNGRFEIVTGGWVMNDEANTHYWSILSQMIEGHEWLKDNLNVNALGNSWAIDPFGLSPTMAYLLKMMGFQGMVIQRVHYSVKKHLAKNRQLEFFWRQHWENDLKNDILSHLEPFYSYDVPHSCGPDPKVCCQFDFKRLAPSPIKCPWKVNPVVVDDNNIEERAKLLLDQFQKKSILYRTRSLLVPLGDDFRFDKAKEWQNVYENYRKLMDYMNSHQEMNVEFKFSTLKDYFDSVQNDSNSQKNFNFSNSSFPSLVGDFFTYCDRENHYWSGYYTSRPFYKRFERILAHQHRSAEILFSLASVFLNQTMISANSSLDHLIGDFVFARQNLALFQHHDAIAGTAKDFVFNDYAKRMFKSLKILEKISSASLSIIFGFKIDSIQFEQMNSISNQAAISRKYKFNLTDISSQSNFVLFNTLGWSVESQPFCFDVVWPSNMLRNFHSIDWCLIGPDGRNIDDFQLNHLWSMSSDPLINQREVCFQPHLSALSLSSYCFGNCNCSKTSKNWLQLKHESFVTLFNYHRDRSLFDLIDYHVLSVLENKSNDPVFSNWTIQNEWIRLDFDSNTGFLKAFSLFDDLNGIWSTHTMNMSIMTYGTKSGGKNVPKSGAYLFLPDNEKPSFFEWKNRPRIRITHGNLESRFELSLDKPFSMDIRFTLWRGRKSVDLQTKFNLQGSWASNRELLIRFQVPEIENGNEFFTDLNGFQLISRKRYGKIPIQGNVYPLNTMAIIEDSQMRFTVISGQPLGTTSPSSGILDVFLDRRLMQDDERGLNQGVTDNKQTLEVFRLFLQKIHNIPLNAASPRFSTATLFESQTLLYPVVGFAITKNLLFNNKVKSFKFLKHSLPCDLLLLNFRRSTNKPKDLVVWFHQMLTSCHSQCKTFPMKTISLNDLFTEDVIERLEPKFIEIGISTMNMTNSHHKYELLNRSIIFGEMQIRAFKLHIN